MTALVIDYIIQSVQNNNKRGGLKGAHIMSDESFPDMGDLPRDGDVEEGDFVCLPKGGTCLYFMRPKTKGISRSPGDGNPMFIKLLSTVKTFGRTSIGDYLNSFGQRFGLKIRRVAKRNKQAEMWQFFKPRKKTN